MITFARRIAYAIPRAIFRVVWLFLEHRFFGATPRTSIQGFEVRNYATETLSPMLFEKIAAALDLIGQYEPRRFARIRRDLKRVVIVDWSGSRAAYLFRSKSCFLQLSHVQNTSSAMIAVSLVHEATHCRLEEAGIHYWPDLQTRIEQRCIREEISFANRLPRATYPGTDALIGQLSRMMLEAGHG